MLIVDPPQNRYGNCWSGYFPRCPRAAGVVFELFGSWFKPELGEEMLLKQLERMSPSTIRYPPFTSTMSLRCFQSILVRLSTDAVFGRRRSASVRHSKAVGLTNRERCDCSNESSTQGLDVTATLISSFRLGKVLSLLPLTRVFFG